MSDELNEPRKKGILHLPAGDRRKPMPERMETLERRVADMAQTLPNVVAEGILAAAGKLYRELYNDLAQEHARVFEVQEAAFMAIAEDLDSRLRVLEERAGIASPSLHKMRFTVDAIGWYFGRIGDGEPLPPWHDLTPEQRWDVLMDYRFKDEPKSETPAPVEEPQAPSLSVP